MEKRQKRPFINYTDATYIIVYNEAVTTEIESVEAEVEENVIYDLTGRRVLNTAKGGIYIQNGKKFIVQFPPQEHQEPTGKIRQGVEER